MTLVEVLVVIAIIAVLIAMLVSAVQKVRESADRGRCQNNLRQIATAVHSYHNVNKHMPSYFAYSEPKVRKGPTNTPRVNTQIYGGWMPHLLPYLEQQSVFDKLMDDIFAAGHATNDTVTLTAGTTGTTSVTPVMVNINGIQYETDTNTTTGGTSATTQTTYHGIWVPGVSNAQFAWAHCPSDPSGPANQLVGANPKAGFMGWALTNYLANWNSWSDSAGDGTVSFGDWSYKKYGFYNGPVKFSQIEDGTSNVILLAEGYAMCDGLGRYAMYTANQHNFGITPGLGKSFTVLSSSGTFDAGTYPPMSNGYPNTFMFQRRPLAKTYAQCKKGEECCNRWLSQTPHQVMHVALVDGSVRSVDPSISLTTWTQAMLPKDGKNLGPDW